MAIEDRNLAAGTKLTATYRKQAHTVLVLADSQGVLGFELDGATSYKSLSAAGSAVMGGIACNGWRFWSIEGDEPLPGTKAPKPPKAPKAPRAKITKIEKAAKAKADALPTVRNIKRVPNQQAVPDGSTKWHCSSCMKSFLAFGTDAPEKCPEGHAREMVDELAPVGSRTRQADDEAAS